MGWDWQGLNKTGKDGMGRNRTAYNEGWQHRLGCDGVDRWGVAWLGGVGEEQESLFRFGWDEVRRFPGGKCGQKESSRPRASECAGGRNAMDSPAARTACCWVFRVVLSARKEVVVVTLVVTDGVGEGAPPGGAWAGQCKGHIGGRVST